jgi:hypothetical protein
VEKCLKFYAMREVADFALQNIAGLIAAAVFVELVLQIPLSTSKMLEVSLLALALTGVVSFLISILSDLFKKMFLSIFLTVLAIASGAWGIHIWVIADRRNEFSKWPLWQISASITLAIIGVVYMLTLIIVILQVRQNLLFNSRNLDGIVIEHLLVIYHCITVHKSDWGEQSQQEQISDSFSKMANNVQRYLPRRLATSLGAGRREYRSLAYQIAEEIRTQASNLFKSEGRKNLIEFTNQYIVAVYQAEWLELPRAEPKVSSLRRTHFLRPLFSSLVPAVVMVALHAGHFLTPNYEPYGWFFAALWFAASVGAWIDPELGERLKVLNVLAGFFTSKSG